MEEFDVEQCFNEAEKKMMDTKKLETLFFNAFDNMESKGISTKDIPGIAKTMLASTDAGVTDALITALFCLWLVRKATNTHKEPL